MASESARKSERRLKFSSVRKLENQQAFVQRSNAGSDTERLARSSDADRLSRGGPLAAIGGILTAGYVAVARRILLGFEVVQDARASRRAVALRSSARAKAIASPRSDASSSSAHPNS